MDIGSRTTHAPDLDGGDRHLAVLSRRTARRSCSRATAAAQQQIYVMGADGSNQQPHLLRRGLATRSRPGRRAATYIAFTRQRNGGFAIGVMKPGRLGRAHPDRGLPQRGRRPGRRTASTCCSSAIPAARRGGKLYMVDITGRVEAAGADAVLRLRPDLVAAADRGALRRTGFPRNHAVIPGLTRDPCRSAADQGSGMDPGSALRSVRDDAKSRPMISGGFCFCDAAGSIAIGRLLGVELPADRGQMQARRFRVALAHLPIGRLGDLRLRPAGPGAPSTSPAAAPRRRARDSRDRPRPRRWSARAP